jgi:hypothetical protein
MLWGVRGALAELVRTLGEDPAIGQVLVFYDQPSGLTGASEESWRAVREAVIAGAALSPVATLVSSTLPELLDDGAAWEFAQAGVAAAAGLRTGLRCAAARLRPPGDAGRLQEIGALPCRAPVRSSATWTRSCPDTRSSARRLMTGGPTSSRAGPGRFTGRAGTAPPRGDAAARGQRASGRIGPRQRLGRIHRRGDRVGSAHRPVGGAAHGLKLAERTPGSRLGPTQPRTGAGGASRSPSASASASSASSAGPTCSANR